MKIAEMINGFFARWGERRMRKIEDAIRSVPEGAALLDMAARDGVKIRFEPILMFMAAAGGYGSMPPEMGGGNAISLNPFLSTNFLISTLAHELRHMWQHRTLKDMDLADQLNFDRQIAFTRFVEGDAFVFQNYLTKKISRATGRWLRSQTFDDYAEEEPDPETTAGQRQIFESFQRSVLAESYDNRVVDNYLTATEPDGRLKPEKDGSDGRLKQAFNLASARDVGDLAAMAAICNDGTCTPYLGKGTPDQMLDDIWRFIKTPDLKAARKTERQLSSAPARTAVQ